MLRTHSSSLAMSVSSSHGFTSNSSEDLAMRTGSEGRGGRGERRGELPRKPQGVSYHGNHTAGLRPQTEAHQAEKGVHQAVSRKMVSGAHHGARWSVRCGGVWSVRWGCVWTYSWTSWRRSPPDVAPSAWRPLRPPETEIRSGLSHHL